MIARLHRTLCTVSIVLPLSLGAQTATDKKATVPRRATGVTIPALSPVERATIRRLAELEDRRLPGDPGEDPLIAALGNPSARVRIAAVRGLGRLQRPALAGEIAVLLRDPDTRVRVEAVNAIGQAMQGARSRTTDAKGKTPDARGTLDAVIDVLVRTAESTGDGATVGTIARTLGRLPYADSVVPREVERVIVEMSRRPLPRAGAAPSGSRPMIESDANGAAGVAHGLYALARSRRQTGAPAADAMALLRTLTEFGLGSPVGVRVTSTADAIEAGARVRRLAHLGLAAAGDTSASIVQRGARDPDEQVRRIAMTAQQSLVDSAGRRAILSAGRTDPSMLVRLEAIRGWRLLPGAPDCQPFVAALDDGSPHVMLAAIDALGGPCSERDRAIETLQRVLGAGVPEGGARTRGHGGWHAYAHALVALSRAAPDLAVPQVRRVARDSVWQVRMYAARAAQAARDTVTLSSLAFDPSGGVREAALSGLSATIGHRGDRTYAAALASPSYNVVLAAATALRGAARGDSLLPPLFAALDRLTGEQRENSRDPRVAVLERIQEFGSARSATRLDRYLTDFDSTVARLAATTIERWMMRRAAADPRALAPPADPIAEVVGGDIRLFVKMAPTSGGGSFVVRLRPDEAPATVARVVRLARSGYYGGLTFHRVEPGFVIQGGSPAATEYVGDGPFMRDEVGLLSHTRGTLGISTRGRDTGDAQLFVNLVDNFRLDHDYTVFGEIVQGGDVAEGVLEGDVIERIDVVRAR